VDYRSIDKDQIVQGVLDTGARNAAEQSLIASIHEEQFRKLLRHDHPSVREVARQQHPDHEKRAAKAGRAHARKMAMASVDDADLVEHHRAILNQFIARNEEEHLQNLLAAEDLVEAIDNDEIDETEPVSTIQTSAGPVPISAATQRQVFENNAAICEAFIEVARKRLAALPKPDASPSKPGKAGSTASRKTR
jgi:hypothetical protein